MEDTWHGRHWFRGTHEADNVVLKDWDTLEQDSRGVTGVLESPAEIIARLTVVVVAVFNRIADNSIMKRI